MRIFRRPATAAAVALGLSVALVVPATATDYWVVDSDLDVEAPNYPGYPDNTWFTGLPTPATAPVSTDDGLVLTGRTQLLYGTAEEALTGDSFQALVESIAVEADGEWSLQIPVFLNGDSQGDFTTLRPAANNTTAAGLTDEWISSSTVGGFTANTPYPLSDVMDEIDNWDLDLNPVLLAVGVLVFTDGAQTTLESFTFSGDTHYFNAAPEVEEPPVVEPPVVEPPAIEPPVEGDDDTAPPATPVEAEATFTG